MLIWQIGDEASEAGAGEATDEASEAGPVYRLLFRSSFAEYFADWLIDAAAEFGQRPTRSIAVGRFQTAIN